MNSGSSWVLLRKILSYGKKYAFVLILSALFLIFAESAVLTSYSYVGKALDYVMGKGEMTPKSALLLTLAISTAAAAFGMLSLALIEYCRNYATYLFNKLTAFHIFKLPMSYYDGIKSGDLASRVENDMKGIRDIFNHTGKNVFSGSIMCAVTLGYMMLQNWIIGIVNLLLVIALIYSADRLGKRSKELSKKARKLYGKAGAYATEAVSGVREIKAFNAINNATRRYGTLLQEAYDEDIRVIKVDNFAYTFSGFSGLLPQIVTFALGGFLALRGVISIGSVLSLQLSVNTLRHSVRNLHSSWAACKSGLSGAERVFEVVDAKSENELWKVESIAPSHSNAEVEFKNVSFAYPVRADEAVLKGVSFKIEKGEKVAIVGESGSGKSTIVKLLCGFYDLDEGEIKIKGKVLHSMTLPELRENFSMVSQDAFLFPITIHNNIAYGRGYGFTESDGERLKLPVDEEIKTAARRAQLTGFIETLPSKYESLVGERGVKLSGGQQQRVSIARAMLKKAPIMILDEPTSALDNHTEYQIQSALDELMEGKTAVVIAHRLSTIKNVDRILVMSGGEIIEDGTHCELMAKKGEYFDLYSRQTDESDVGEEGA